MINLSHLTDEIKTYFGTYGFDLNLGINEIQTPSKAQSVLRKGTETTPLIFAIYDAKIKIISELLNKGADINQVDDHGVSPLMHAVDQDYLEAFELLLDHPSGKKLNINYCVPEPDATRGPLLDNENVLFFLIRNAFDDVDADDNKLLEIFEIHKKMLQRIIVRENINLIINYDGEILTVFDLLVQYFEQTIDRTQVHFRLPFLLNLLQTFLNKPNTKLLTDKETLDEYFDDLDEEIFEVEITNLTQKLINEGFNLNSGFNQTAKGVSLLNFAAKNQNDGLLFIITIQSNFRKEYSEQEILKSFYSAFETGNMGCSFLLFTFLKPTYKLFRNVIEKAITANKPSLIENLVDYYFQLRDETPNENRINFNLLDTENAYQYSLISRSLKLNCDYLLLELFRLTAEHGPNFNPTQQQQNNLSISKRLKAYTVQFLERHDSSSLVKIKNQVIQPIMEYYDHYYKLIINYGFYKHKKYNLETESRQLVKTNESVLSPVHVTHILSFLDKPFDTIMHIKDFNLRSAAARNALTWYENSVRTERSVKKLKINFENLIPDNEFNEILLEIDANNNFEDYLSKQSKELQNLKNSL